MDNIDITVKKVFETCDLFFENQMFSKELLLRSFENYLVSTAYKNKHNVGIILHTGSIVFDIISVIYAAISNMVVNETDCNDILESLEPGDMVLYGQKHIERYTFEGVCNINNKPGEEYALLEGSKTTYVPKRMWKYILPYNGESKRLDGRGLKKQSGIREDFYKIVLQTEEKDIPLLIDTSTVIVMPRDKADKIINGVSIGFSGKIIKLTDIVTASYFTENDEYRYGGNVGKNEPVLKFTGKISNARELVLDRDGNKKNGLIISGNDIIARGETELPELLKRRSLKYVFVLTPIDSEFGTELINEYEEVELFACTKDFLLSNSTVTRTQNALTSELQKQVDAIIDKEIVPVVMEGCLSWNDSKEFKKAMIAIKGAEFEDDDKENFIIQAHSLVNLLTTACFKISELEEAIASGELDYIESPSERIRTIEDAANKFPGYLKTKSNKIVEIIEKAYIAMTETSEKENYIFNYLRENKEHKIAIIVPKAYYEIILRKKQIYNYMESEENLFVSTANRFDNSKTYDDIICLGDFCGKRFNPFRCHSSANIITLLYDFEANMFKYRMKKASKIEHLYNSRSSIDCCEDESFDKLVYDNNASESELELINRFSDEINKYVDELNVLADLKFAGACAHAVNTAVESVAFASFETGEKVFFSKMFKGYVFNDISGEIKEIKCEDLEEGDSIVFTQNNSETRDIVDGILSGLVENRRVSEKIINSYYKSKEWKEKLIEHMNKTDSSPKTIAEKMIANGVQVQEITIRKWLDEDSHIVGPRKKDSIEQIALLIDNEKMYDNSDDYFESCNLIRHIRRSILKTIGEAIINKLSGKDLEKIKSLTETSEEKEIYEKLDSLALILKIESINFVTREVPLNMINRPIILKE